MALSLEESESIMARILKKKLEGKKLKSDKSMNFLRLYYLSDQTQRNQQWRLPATYL